MPSLKFKDENGRWRRVTGGASVSTFNGRAGAVKPQEGDYTAEMVGADVAGSAAQALSDAKLYVDEQIDAIPTPDVSGQIKAHNEDENAHQDIRDSIPTNVSQLANDSGYLTEFTETDPTVPAWAKAENKPTYTAAEVGADEAGAAQSALDEAKVYIDQQIDAIPEPDIEGPINAHNTSDISHNDIRLLIGDLTNRLNALADSDDTTLDQLSEIVAYIKSNKDLIDAITTGKVSVSDIVDDLTTNVSDKPLSAAQGVALKALIDAIVIPTNISEFINDSGYLTEFIETDPTVPAWAKAEHKPVYTAEEVGADEVGSSLLALVDAKAYTDQQIAAIPTPDVSGQIETHNEDENAHQDIRDSVSQVLTDAKEYTDDIIEAFGSGVAVGPDEPVDGDVWIDTDAVIEGDQYGIVVTFNDRTGNVIPQEGDYTAEMVGADAAGSAAQALTDAKAYTDEQIALIPTPDVSGQINAHNIDSNSHADIRSAIPTKTSDLNNDSNFATISEVENKVAALVDSAPEALNTLNELAQALGDDPNFTATIATQIGGKVDKVDGKGLSTNDYTTEEKEKLAMVTNPNLLDNWYFANPVNQRGKTEYLNISGLTIDRWSLQNTHSIKVVSGGIQIIPNDLNNRYFSQRVEGFERLAGKRVTVSTLIGENTYANTSYIGFIINDSASTLKNIPSGSTGVFTISVTLPENLTELRVLFRSNASLTESGTLTVVAAKLELGSTQTLAHQDASGNWVLNEIPDYHEELLKCRRSTASPSDTYANQPVAHGYITNQNLLHNWYFVNPVNQRGKTEYTEFGYTIDRWKMGSTSGTGVSTVSIRQNEYLSVDCTEKYIRLAQTLDDATFVGKKAVISILAADGLHSNTLTIGAASGGVNVGIATLYSTMSGNLPTIILDFKAGAVYNIIAIKLELGDTQTLAHQDTDGNWVLNEIPDYNEELLKCCMSTADPADECANNKKTATVIGAMSTTGSTQIPSGSFESYFNGGVSRPIGYYTTNGNTLTGMPFEGDTYWFIFRAPGVTFATCSMYPGRLWFSRFLNGVFTGWKRVVDTDYALNKAGDTMTGSLIAHTATDYSTYRMRNVAILSATPESMNNGDIALVYS